MSTRSVDGREWALIDQAKAGSKLIADGGFRGCIRKGAVLTVQEDEAGLFVPCRDGNHYLVGQENDSGSHFVGLWPQR